ncbi:MAG: hypothetical protein E7602_01920 [Ruminococcaceae bacterium]|nr:hypothetical protein [Oscillospiraceae bacterium]
MREKIYNVMNKIYGISILVSLFAGFLPVIPFILAIIIGGETGANISVFLYKQYYPWVAVLASLAVIIGIVALYIGGKITFKFPKKAKKDKLAKEKKEELMAMDDAKKAEENQAIADDAVANEESKEDQEK